MASDNVNDDLVIGARIDQLTRTVAELIERFEQREQAAGDRVDDVARRVGEAAERLEAGLAETDATVALRLEQATTSVRARVEQVLAELREHRLADRVAGEDLIAGRAAGLESGVAELSELLPELRAMTASVSSTVTALAVSTSGLASYVQEVMSSAEAVGPKVDAALVAVEERMFERSDRDDASLRARLDQAAGSLESFGSQIESVVERAVHRSSEGTAGEVVGQVAGTLEAVLSRLTAGQVDELASLGAGLTEELMRLTQVQGAEIARMRHDVTDEVAKLRIEAAAHTGGLTNGLTAALHELQSRGAEDSEQIAAALLAEVQRMRAAAKEANDGLTEAAEELRATVLEQISELRDQVAVQGASTKVVADETLRDITAGLAQMEAAASDGAVAALDARAELFASVAASQEASAAGMASRSEVMAQTVLDQLDRLQVMLETEQAAVVTAVASGRDTMQEVVNGLNDQLRATLTSLDHDMRSNIVGERADVTNVLRELGAAVTTSLSDEHERLTATLVEIDGRMRVDLGADRGNMIEALQAGQAGLTAMLTVHNDAFSKKISDEQSRIEATLATMREDLAMLLREERDSMATVVHDGQQVFVGQQDHVRVLLADGLSALTSTFQQEQ
ncbi:MAG: hypothetical protein ACI970_000848, partial [Myxococcota bacterium]